MGAVERAEIDVVLAPADVRRRAREILGHRTLLPGQSDAVRAIVAGKDTLVLLPTGGGKSAIYQLAGLERAGSTIVVSPLLALQQDQLDGLRELDLPARALNSTLSASEREETLSEFERGDIEFLLLAPEQLASPDVLERLCRAEPSLLVVDEAHCVSEWGHDFRPEYRRLGAVRDALGGPPILALTATASPAVRDDICRWLGMDQAVVVARGFDRPELILSVTLRGEERTKRDGLLDWVATEAQKPGIVYAATRRAAEELAALLEERGLRCAAYHAGQPHRDREQTLDRFMANEIDVVVATIAFGMGVDKPNVRFVAHYDPSDSIEAYHQEIGRAGRDGVEADARLFFNPADLGLRRFQSVPPALSVDDVQRVIRALREGALEFAEIAASTRKTRSRVEQVVGRLEEIGVARILPTGGVELSSIDGREGQAEAVRNAINEQERRRRFARTRVDLLREYAETRGCRRRFLLNALGEEFEAPCAACDNCLSGVTQEMSADVIDGPFRLNDTVVHSTFGHGEVTRVEREVVGVRFEIAGYKTFALPEVIDLGLLKTFAPEPELA